MHRDPQELYPSAAGSPDRPDPDRKLPGRENPPQPADPLSGQRNPDPGPFIDPVKDPTVPAIPPTDPLPRPHHSMMME